MPSFKLVLFFVFFFPFCFFFWHPLWPLRCEILFFSVKMSALSASGMPVLIENCSNLLTSNKDLYSFTLFPIIPFLVGLHIYITSITISSGSKTENEPSDKRFGKSKNKTAQILFVP